MTDLTRLTSFIYNYCTDFVINIANLTGLSYFEINALIFLIIWPTVTMLLILLYIIQRIRLRKL